MKSRILTIILIAASALTSGAQSAVESLIDSIVANNPELNALNRRTVADIASLAPTNNLADPEVEFTHQWGQQGVGNKWGIEASQSFDWPGVYSARSRANNAAAKAMEIEYAVRRNELAYEVRCALTDAIYARKRIMLQSHQLDVIDSLQRVYDRGAARGEVSLLDVNKLKIERIRIASRLTDATVAHEDAIGRLAVLAGNYPIDLAKQMSEFPEEKLLPASVYITRAMDNSPALAYAKAMDRTEELNMDVVRKSRIPGFSIGYMHEYEIGEHFNGLKIGMTLPIFSSRHKDAEIMARREAIETEISSKELEIESEIKADCRKIARLDADIASYIDALNTNDNPRLLNIALAARHITLIQYLTEINYFLEAAESLIDLQLQRQQTMNHLPRY